MNILLWVLQVLLALHTLTGAFWKFSNSAEQTMPSLGVIPNGLWMAMAVIEILVSLALVVPVFKKSLGQYVSKAAIVIAAEMLIFCVLHLVSGATEMGPMIYWLVVAALCAFIAYGRMKLKPI